MSEPLTILGVRFHLTSSNYYIKPISVMGKVPGSAHYLLTRLHYLLWFRFWNSANSDRLDEFFAERSGSEDEETQSLTAVGKERGIDLPVKLNEPCKLLVTNSKIGTAVEQKEDPVFLN